MHLQTFDTAVVLAVAQQVSAEIIKELIGENVAGSLAGNELGESALTELVSSSLALSLPNAPVIGA